MGHLCCTQDRFDLRKQKSQLRIRSVGGSIDELGLDPLSLDMPPINDPQLENYVPVQRLAKLEGEMSTQLEEARKVHNYLNGEAGRLTEHVENMSKTYNTQMEHLVRFTHELR